MIRKYGLVRVGALLVAWGLTACGSTSRSCPSVDAECSAAGDEGDGDGAGGADQGGSGGAATDGTPDDTAEATAEATGAGATGGTGPVPGDRTPGEFDCGEADAPTPLVRLTNTQYDNTVYYIFGVETLDAFDGSRPSALLVDDPPDSISDLGWEAYRVVAEAIAEQVMAGPLATSFLMCDPTEPGCLSETIASFGREAFRRPLTDEERADYEDLIPDDLTEASDTTARTILAAMLAAPSFVWRAEQGGPGEPTLTSYEVASRLAYFFWNAPPDVELSAAADADELATDEQLTAQARRMTDDLRLRRSFAEFHRGYLGVPGSPWGAMAHDTQRFPAYSSEMDESAMAELALFLDDIIASGGGFQDLFLSDIGYVNQHTAPVYGLAPESFGSELVRVQLDATQRPGLFTRVAFLSSFSREISTNPTLRGSFITQEILNVPLPDLPREFDRSDFPNIYATTNRDRMTMLTEAPGCVECHSVYTDPIGFVLENYDAVGAWQTVDQDGGTIYPVANVFFGDRTEVVETSLELMQKLADSSFAQRHYADEIVAYAFSRPPNARDACLADALTASMAEHTNLVELWLEVVGSDAFRIRGTASD